MNKTPEFVKLPDSTMTNTFEAYIVWKRKSAQLEKKNNQARAIMEKFVFKVDTGRARSTETYAEMKQWLEDK